MRHRHICPDAFIYSRGQLVKYKKKLRRADGLKVEIEVSLSLGHDLGRVKWDFNVWTCKPRCRTWESAVDSEAFAYKAAMPPKRRAMRWEQCLKVVTEEELLEAMTHCWELLKPTKESVLA